MPHWDRPSKYQRDANVRAKINTGLGPGSSQNQANAQGNKPSDDKKVSNTELSRDDENPKEKKSG